MVCCLFAYCNYILFSITCYIGLKDYQPAMELLQSKLDHGAPEDKAELLVMRARLHLLFGNVHYTYSIMLYVHVYTRLLVVIMMYRLLFNWIHLLRKL